MDLMYGGHHSKTSIQDYGIENLDYEAHNYGQEDSTPEEPKYDYKSSVQIGYNHQGSMYKEYGQRRVSLQ